MSIHSFFILVFFGWSSLDFFSCGKNIFCRERNGCSMKRANISPKTRLAANSRKISVIWKQYLIQLLKKLWINEKISWGHIFQKWYPAAFSLKVSPKLFNNLKWKFKYFVPLYCLSTTSTNASYSICKCSNLTCYLKTNCSYSSNVWLLDLGFSKRFSNEVW